MADHNILDKSMRSVFVGNIPYEATEEKLRDIFNEIGPVVSFKLVYDRETGKPKGYGFCEYKDQETALSAMRNLNCYEISGRTLRVDNACTEKSRLEMQSLLMGMPTSESLYGNAISAEKAPDVINNIISTLPPEQLYELMKQMKDCVQNNPVEARNMLLQNPQLSYALLQAQVLMKIVEPETAKKMLYPTNTVPVQLHSTDSSTLNVQPLLPNNSNQWQKPCTSVVQTNSPDWHHMNGPSNQQPIHIQAVTQHNQLIESHLPFSGYLQTPGLNVKNQSFTGRRSNNSFVPILPLMSVPPPSIKHPIMLQKPPPKIQPLPQSQQTLPSQMDSEKETLILQVLQLTEEQIAMLPEDQRQSLIQLREKIINSSYVKENH